MSELEKMVKGKNDVLVDEASKKAWVDKGYAPVNKDPAKSEPASPGPKGDEKK